MVCLMAATPHPVSSPRPGRKLTQAITIPKQLESRLFLEPLPPNYHSALPTSISSSPKRNGALLSDLVDEGPAPHPPSSPRPSTPNFHHFRSPFGSPESTTIPRRRHTFSVVPQSVVDVPQVRHHNTFPFELSQGDVKTELEIEKDAETAHRTVNNDLPHSTGHQVLPSSSSCFQQAMIDLKSRPSLSSVSSTEDDASSIPKGQTISPRDSDRPQLPVIEISSIEANYDQFSVDITNENDDNVFAPASEEEPQLSSSAPDTFMHPEAKATSIHRLQMARVILSSSELSLHQATSSKQLHEKHSKRTKGNKDGKPVLEVKPKTHKGKGVVFQKKSRLSVDFSPVGLPLRKWRSMEGYLSTLGTVNPAHRDHPHLDHSPFISSPAPLRRKASDPLGSITASKLKHQSHENLQKDADQESSPRNSVIASSCIGNVSPAPSTSPSSGSCDSPMSSPRMSKKTDPSSPKSSKKHHDLVSPLNLKTVAKITRFITAAAASSTIPGGNKRQQLFPDAVTLPPVLDSSGRLRVHRRRDDSMRLVKQAVDSDNMDWMDVSDQGKGKRKAKSVLGFSER